MLTAAEASHPQSHRRKEGRGGEGLLKLATYVINKAQGATLLLAPFHLSRSPFLCLESALENTLSIYCVKIHCTQYLQANCVRDQKESPEKPEIRY